MKFLIVCTLLALAAFGSTDAVCGPTVCNLLWDPICGSDGVTYGNQCMFNAQKECDPSLTVVKPGQC
ncbi:hypothetical protein V1264_022494 [Littorina saxatilis]|uniref:Kazal-like domain-containing protein n=1 Tax=Littorina saxatilis TaxID=31220 RepID=A0AAN9AKE9_9CAEN